MQYNEIYDLFGPIFKWLQEHYPHDTYFVIDSSSATMYHKDSIMSLDGYKPQSEVSKYTSEQVVEMVKKVFEA